MAAKSRYQMVNRGRKGKPSWYVEDRGVYCYSSSRRSLAEGYLKMLRRMQRDIDRAAKEMLL